MVAAAPSQLIEQLRSISPFYYWPNNGNLGDLLIAEATRQFFQRHALEYREYSPQSPPAESSFNLVYGGGGRLTSHWPGTDSILQHLTAPQVGACIILPHSLFGVDSFILGLDGRHTIICREERSHSYCTALRPRARVQAGHDMALLLQLDTPTPPPQPGNTEESRRLYSLMTCGLPRVMLKLTRRSTITATIGGRRQKTAFILRTDKEKAAGIASPLSYDISLAWVSTCRHTPCNGALIHAFAQALDYADVVVTDRLHVGIMAHLLGKRVFLLDNDYGKLAGVYRQSLANEPNVTLLPGGLLTPELQAAWKRFTGWPRNLAHTARGLLKKALLKLQR